MTTTSPNSTVTTAEAEAEAEAEVQARPAGQLEHIDPAVLVIEDNVRATERIVLDAEFLDSVAQHGVLVPVLAWRDAAGVVRVRAGQRRTLAARQAGLDSTPVYLVAADQVGGGSTAGRIVEQLVENEQRHALTDVNRVVAWHQLALDGLTEATIARRVGVKQTQVAAGLAVAASSSGAALLDEGMLTLDQAAVLVEFEDDSDLMGGLVEVASTDPDYFPVAVQRARNERTIAAAVKAREAVEVAAGHRLLAATPAWGSAPWPLTHFSRADGQPAQAEDVTGADGVAVRVTPGGAGQEVRVVYYLDDPDALGLTRLATTVAASLNGGSSATDASGSASGEDAREEARDARRLLIARNKEWDAATTVRAEWLTGFLARKTLPKNATTVLAGSLVGAAGLVAESMSRGSDTAKTLLGLETGWGTRLGAYLDQHATRPLHVALAVVLGGIEQTLTRDTWRHPQAPSAAYLNAIAGWGYPLCPVERIAAGLDNGGDDLDDGGDGDDEE